MSSTNLSNAVQYGIIQHVGIKRRIIKIGKYDNGNMDLESTCG